MTREEAIAVLKAFMENPLFSDAHKAAFNIAIHDIKQRHYWDINNMILINKDNYEPQEPCDGWHDIPSEEMTLEQARQAVKDLRKMFLDNWMQEPTTKDLEVDCIDKTELLKAMSTYDKFGYTETGCFVREPKNDYVPYVHYEDMVNCVKGMPSVTPHTRKGHWVLTDVEGDKVWHCNCSECGKDPQDYVGGSENWWLIKGKLPKFCPSCGSDNDRHINCEVKE